MKRKVEFLAYRAKTILNKHKRADHWFWTRYSAYPYMGCQHGCAFCYCREQKYLPHDDPDDFSYLIKVKKNAPDLLRKALQRTSVDVVMTGDYQPAERTYQISRQMLEVCCELGFPVFVLERSALVVRDLDVLQQINKQTPSIVAFSIIHSKESPQYAQIRALENFAPVPEMRFKAMKEFAKQGILTGTCLMPILPGLCDEDANLESVIRQTAENGGRFVLASTLTLSDQQKDYFLKRLQPNAPHLVNAYQKWYPAKSYSPQGYAWNRIALRVRELCEKYGISDRIPRPIIPGEKFDLNKRVVEMLANQAYAMEIEQKPSQRIWAYRKAAWSVEDLEQDIGLIYKTMGLKGIQNIKDVGPALAERIEKLLLNAYAINKQQPIRDA